ncbi:MAG TPA: DEAD/DEAH box helicase [Bacteroidales bacterium]|nr:DEAD/DEAH box helicase [Bacteroidales bacterium]HPS18078.1 DEAD/DEAH box helicase [Bacteroidales bacterium]
MIFEDLNLNKPLLQALDDLEYTNPTPIQEKVFPLIMDGRDVLGIAQTGTGKTFAYLLPILRQLKFSEQKHPRILIVVPTRELVLQVVGEINKLITYMSVRVGGVYGGTNINTQKQIVYNGLDILVATPGRLIDLALCGTLRLSFIQKFVIDEAEEMFNMGFRTQLKNVIDLLPPKRQNLLFSATMMKDIENIISDFFITPQKIEIAAHGAPLEQISQVAYYVPNYYTKANLLENLVLKNDELNKVLVFCESRKLADRLFDQMKEKFPDQLGVIHSNKSQNFRINSLKQFQDGNYRVLIATDIAARGLDISDVSHVINFDTPKIPVDYIHRIGRTGRADKTGVAITFINEAERIFQIEIEGLMKKPIPIEPLPEDVIISKIFTDEELPPKTNKNYLKNSTLKSSGGAFHEKLEKNKKVNLGGSYKRNLRLKYKKPKSLHNNKKREKK